MNYDLYPSHWDFDHAWSLCIEEHFYILLPIIFILLRVFNSGVRTLFIVTSLLIATGIVFKIYTYYTDPTSEAYYFETQNRIDALAWGVLMNLFLTYTPEIFKKLTKNFIVLTLGALLFFVTLYIDKTSGSAFFHRVLLHTFIPLSFFLMLAGVYHFNFSKLKVLRFVAYYSYNWYLWHPIVAMLVLTFMGFSYTSLAIYIAASFLAAMLFTMLIEEPFLKYRKTILGKLFKKQVKAIKVEKKVFEKSIVL
jgi:peptidoglycan/LPS O-acetylase OafA/YrhL